MSFITLIPQGLFRPEIYRLAVIISMGVIASILLYRPFSWLIRLEPLEVKRSFAANAILVIAGMIVFSYFIPFRVDYSNLEIEALSLRVREYNTVVYDEERINDFLEIFEDRLYIRTLNDANTRAIRETPSVMASLYGDDALGHILLYMDTNNKVVGPYALTLKNGNADGYFAVPLGKVDLWEEVQVLVKSDEWLAGKPMMSFYILRRIEGTDEYEKEAEPVFTIDDIESYNWSTHEIIFKDRYDEPGAYDNSDDGMVMAGSGRLRAYYPDMFEVYVEDRLIYDGFFMPQMFISFMPDKPVITDTEDGIIIEHHVLRDNPRERRVVRDVLIEHGVFIDDNQELD